MGMKKPDTSKPPGPEPERLEIEGDWEEAVAKALKKKRPTNGWPLPEKQEGRGD